MWGIVGKIGENTNFEPNLKWDPHILFSGSKMLCVLLHEEMKNKHSFAQIYGGLNEIMASKVGTMVMVLVKPKG